MEALSIKEIAEAVGGTILWGDENAELTSVTTNSKNLEEGALFIPIIGERVDAHDFIEDAFLHGAKACFTSRKMTINKDKIYIGVEDTKKALQALGTFYRSRFNIPVVGITGSVGKTTTKEMIAAALETKYRVLKTEGNMNSQVGLPLMMLRMNATHEIAVIEMGMSEEGEMEQLTRIAKPEAAVLTNIGVSHIAQLKTKENIRKEKMNIINAFLEQSVLFINGNDELLSDLIEESNERNSNIDLSLETQIRLWKTEVVAFGTADYCGYRAENIRTVNGKTHFIVRQDKEGETGLEDEGEEIVLQVLGIHNVYNALAALAVAKHYQIPISVSKMGLLNYKPIAMRGQIRETKGLRIIDDSYNASPDSMKSGIQVLLELEGVKRRIAVLADVMELGEISKQCHYEVGEYIARQSIDEVITIGKEAYYIAQAIRDKNTGIQVNSFDNNMAATDYLLTHLVAGDGILIKGSRGMKTDEIVKALG